MKMIKSNMIVPNLEKLYNRTMPNTDGSCKNNNRCENRCSLAIGKIYKSTHKRYKKYIMSSRTNKILLPIIRVK